MKGKACPILGALCVGKDCAIWDGENKTCLFRAALLRSAITMLPMCKQEKKKEGEGHA